ncbi:ExbD/TolR family protein [Entomobacter blattae]|uniref:Biopolymer transport protein ExbD n=1 Tax=Entomobacter blattae TaxID=2762277 RepID=A0A7H1NR90_9PROT|nr:biopolymer transporter ExbD [Entomobacter blattae]QNT78300.1 Biopolymer transport protein ExbD [Entomobacter blattae]
MAMQIGGQDNDEDHIVAAINTTPLVDVMLVLLIIFLITIPAATHTIRLHLPKESSHPTQTQQGNVVLAVTADGQIYWNETPIATIDELSVRLAGIANGTKQPQVQIRGDGQARYETVGRIVDACKQAGIARVDFITERPHQ